MRTTIRIDDDLLRDLKGRAQKERTSLTKLVNRVLRQGMRVLDRTRQSRRPHREKTYAMGEPKCDLDKAIALAATLEDEEVLAKLARRK